MARTIDTPAKVVTRSQLRDPRVVNRAVVESLRVDLGAGLGSFVTMPEAKREELLRILDLTAVFTRTVLELRRDRPSAAMLGDVSFAAGWSSERRERFLEGFTEALAEAVRLRSPAPVDAYIQVMSTLDQLTKGAYLLGKNVEEGELETLRTKRPGIAG